MKNLVLALGVAVATLAFSGTASADYRGGHRQHHHRGGYSQNGYRGYDHRGHGSHRGYYGGRYVSPRSGYRHDGFRGYPAYRSGYGGYPAYRSGYGGYPYGSRYNYQPGFSLRFNF